MRRIASRTRRRVGHDELVDDAGPAMVTCREATGIVSSRRRAGRASIWRTILAGRAVPTPADPGVGAFPPVAAGRSSQYWSIALTGAEAHPPGWWEAAKAGAAPTPSSIAALTASVRTERGRRAVEIGGTSIVVMLLDVRTP
jgi:hypothetical protein